MVFIHISFNQVLVRLIVLLYDARKQVSSKVNSSVFVLNSISVIGIIAFIYLTRI